MTLKDKAELVRLLFLYMIDLLGYNEKNIKEAKRHQGNLWEGEYKLGVKAQYEHARIIATKLASELGKELKSYWEL